MCSNHGEPRCHRSTLHPQLSAECYWAPQAASSDPDDIPISVLHALERRNLFVSARGPALITGGKPPPYSVFSFSSNVAAGPRRPSHKHWAV